MNQSSDKKYIYINIKYKNYNTSNHGDSDSMLNKRIVTYFDFVCTGIAKIFKTIP